MEKEILISNEINKKYNGFVNYYFYMKGNNPFYNPLVLENFGKFLKGMTFERMELALDPSDPKRIFNVITGISGELKLSQKFDIEVINEEIKITFIE